MSFGFRHYQPAAVEAVFQRWDAGDRGTLVWMATGTGKTAVAAMVASRIVRAGGRVLFVAHREDLLDGAHDAFKRELSSMQILYELNVERVWTSDIDSGKPDAVIASVQSIHRRLEKYPADFFTHIIIDESHRAAAQSYLKIVHHFPEARLLYLTATPGRSDGKSLKGYTYDPDAEPTKAQKALLATCCQSTAFTFGLGDAIADGWLVDPIPRIVNVEVDWSTLKLSGGDYKPEDVDAIMREDGPLHKVAVGLVEQVKGRCGVVFMPGVESAHGLAHRLRDSYGIDAQALDGRTEKTLRREIIARAKAGDLECLVNVGVAIEGFDSPAWTYVADCQPTRHLGRYQQKLGRGVRPIDGSMFDGIGGERDRQARLEAIASSAKPKWLMLDFVGNMGNLPKPITAKDVLLGELPHKDYGGQPTPKQGDVAHVLARRPSLSIEDARQRASDELYMHEVLMAPRYRASVQGEVRVQEFESLFSIPFVWKAKGPREYKRPPPGREASDKQKGLIKYLYRLERKKEPSPEWFDSLTKQQAGRIIVQMKAKAGA